MDTGKLNSVFDSDPDGTVFLIKVTPDDYQQITATLIQDTIDNGLPVIYVAVKRPYVHLKKLLDQQHIAENNVYVVDAITKTITDEGVIDAENVSFLDSPQNLTNVSTSISVMAGKTGADNAVLIIDSLESLLTYNTEKDVSTFLEDLNNRTQTLELDLVLFKQEQSIDEQIGSTLYPIVDEIMLLGEDEVTGATVTGMQDDKALVEIPADILRALGWDEDEDLSLTVNDGALTMEPK